MHTLTKRYCQYCATEVIRANTSPFVTCDDCKKQRAAILKGFNENRKFVWVCLCRKRIKYSEPYCEKCFTLRKDGRKILKSTKTLPLVPRRVAERKYWGVRPRCRCVYERGMQNITGCPLHIYEKK